jgi:hypothetical protein
MHSPGRQHDQNALFDDRPNGGGVRLGERVIRAEQSLI